MSHFILGIDEVGLGPWAGPLVMGGCILPERHTFSEHHALPEHHTLPDHHILPDHQQESVTWIEQLNDSKQLSLKKREKIYAEIKAHALASATGWVFVSELNELGLSASLRLACRRVVESIREQGIPFHEIIIDGNTNYLQETNLGPFTTTVIKGDCLIKEISAASILAKVERDRYMVQKAQEYPDYDFKHNVGYGTKKHIAAIDSHGLTPEHRIFIKAIASKFQIQVPAYQHFHRKNTTSIGQTAEALVASFLELNGHEIIAQNFKTKLYEIDIISKKDQTYFFTEVKFRENNAHGAPIEAVTEAKLRQMKLAAETYVDDHKITDPYRLAAAQVSGGYHLDFWTDELE